MQVTKKRFFIPKEPSPPNRSEGTGSQQSPPSPPSSSLPTSSLFISDEEDDDEDEQNKSASPDIAIIEQPQISANEFNQSLISTVGDISPIILSYLYDKFSHFPNAVKLATKEILTCPPDIDELLQQEDNKTRLPPSTQTQQVIPASQQTKKPSSFKKRPMSQDISTQLQSLEKRMHLASQAIKEEIEQNSWKKYIGTIDVQAWATRPIFRPLQYAQKLHVKRLIPRNSTMQKSSIIRLCTQDEQQREIGRLPEELTRVLSPLIDLNIAEFETTILEETKKRLSIGDSFFIQIDVFLKNTGFVKNLDAINEEESNLNNLKRKQQQTTRTGFNFSAETDGEAALRLRQFALSNLFERLRIHPLRITNDDNEVAEEDEQISSQDPIDLDSDGEEDSDEPEQQLNLDQLREFYQENNQSKLLDNLPETTNPPKENFNLNLRPYQKHGLSWMLTRENEINVLDKLSNEKQEDGQQLGLSTQGRRNIQENESGTMNPLWRRYKWPRDRSFGNDSSTTSTPTQGNSQDNNKYFYANMYNGELSIEKPIIKNSLRGGILADEMGLGKTISTLALVNSVPYDVDAEIGITKGKKPYAPRTTLIVVPMSLLSQWKQEFETSNNNKNHVCRVYYGDEIESNLTFSLCNHNNEKIPVIMLTTYGTILNEFTRISKGRDSQGNLPQIGLYSVKFFRIILDEGHNIRNRNTKTAKSVYELDSDRKWILTGTPIVNRLDDLYSLAKFLQLDPWGNFSYWKTFVTLPFEQKKIFQTLDVIKSILEPIFLRRTKDMKGKDGKPLVELPEKEVVIEEIKFNEQEEKLYSWFKQRAHSSFAEGIKSGQLLRQYTQILTHILRLRQVCCHMDLIGGAHEMDDEVIDMEQDEEMKSFLKGIKEQQQQQHKFENDTEVKKIMYGLYPKVNTTDSECSICTTTPIPIGEMTITPCGHSYCLSCLLEHLDFNDGKAEKKCPNCREPISKYKLFRIRHQPTTSNEIRFHTQKETESQQQYDFQLYLHDPNRSSSKIQALIRHLHLIKTQSPNSKCIVFSQFSSYLDLIQTELKLQTNDEFIVYKFDGRLNIQDRQKLLTNFNAEITNGKVVVLLLSLKAGGVGLNLTTANRAFMMDPWWSPSIEEQAIDRIHRIGQNETVKVVRFIMENSIETKMLKIQERKKKMGEAVGAEEEERRKRRIEEIQILFEE
ncbi:RAD5 [[Candida] subhashii]|uniref:DNA repair protein RAD5 n=1 Tax=[Candida] subhashii TaxID=561895 RepID=A0A8J5QJR3_9ASCO|nr:RAD5 [[Candida] subhashii]KAG7663418.1 RAD5 [[Candida] subhashii]